MKYDSYFNMVFLPLILDIFIEFSKNVEYCQIPALPFDSFLVGLEIYPCMKDTCAVSVICCNNLDMSDAGRFYCSDIYCTRAG